MVRVGVLHFLLVRILVQQVRRCRRLLLILLFGHPMYEIGDDLGEYQMTCLVRRLFLVIRRRFLVIPRRFLVIPRRFLVIRRRFLVIRLRRLLLMSLVRSQRRCLTLCFLRNTFLEILSEKYDNNLYNLVMFQTIQQFIKIQFCIEIIHIL